MASTGNSLQNNFNRQYEKTGPQQRMVVDTIEGSLLVMASPGIKTAELLALRTAGIVLNTGSSPGNIVCLTSSDISAIILQKHLEQITDADSPNVSIHSFSSFCRQVITDNPAHFYNRSLQPVTLLESINIFKKLINSFPDGHLLKRYRGDVYHEINNLQNLFSMMKREGLTPAFIREKLDAVVTELHTGKMYFGNIDTGEAFTLIEKLQAAINEFDRYQALLQMENRHDEDDIVYLVVKELDENKDLLSRYHKKFPFIQADATGSINDTYYKLLQLLAGGDEKANVLVISNQEAMGTIAFHLKNKPSFANNWISLPLNDNDDHAIAGGLAQRGENMPVIRMYPTATEEMAAIVNQVDQLQQQNIPAANIAVIYPNDEYGVQLEGYFNFKKIAFCNRRGFNILKDPFIKKIIQLLRYINAELELRYSGDALLFEILHFDFYGVPPFEIAKLAVEVNAKKYGNAPTAIRKLLQERVDAPAKDLFDPGMNKDLQKTSLLLEKFIEESAYITPLQLFTHIIDDEQIRQYVNQSPGSNRLMKLLNTLGDFIKTETARNPHLQLDELVTGIDIMETTKLELPVLFREGSTGDTCLIKAGELIAREFDYVFFAGANHFKEPKHDWLDCVYMVPGIAFYNKAPFDNSSFYHLSVEAFTGKRTGLFISLASHDEDGKELEPAAFVADIMERHSLPINEINLPEDQWKSYITNLKSSRFPEIAPLEDSLITPAVNKFVMNVSALNSYLNCPLGFYYKNIIRVPDSNNEALQFGSAVHYALENLFKQMLDGQSSNQYQFPPVLQLIGYFKGYMQNNRRHFTKEAFERRRQYGEQVLTNYYTRYVDTWNKVVTVERNIRGVTVNHVPLKGKLDKLEFNGLEVNIVDYKSGDIDKAITKMKPPHEKDPNGGDYWRQAVFYTLLVDNYPLKKWKVTSTEFDFVEPDKKGAYRKEKLAITPADIETVKQQLTLVWGKIQARDFYTGCGKADCHWCNFVKDNRLAVAMHQKTEERSAY